MNLSGIVIERMVSNSWVIFGGWWNREKCPCIIIFWHISVLNSFICFLMYRKNASLDQCPRSIIVNTGMSARYIAIAAPLLAECKPIWLAKNPKCQDQGWKLLSVVASIAVNLWIVVLTHLQKSMYLLSYWDLKKRIWRFDAQSCTKFWLDKEPYHLLCGELLSFFASLFCCLKVIDTVSDKCNEGLWLMFCFQ